MQRDGYAGPAVKSIVNSGSPDPVLPDQLFPRGKRPKSKPKPKPKPKAEEEKPTKQRSHNLFRGENNSPRVNDVVQGPIHNCWVPASIIAVLLTPNGEGYIKSLFDVSGPNVQVKLPGITTTSSGGSSAKNPSSCFSITREEAESTVFRDGDSVGGLLMVKGAP